MGLLIALGALAIYATAAYFLREKAEKRDILLAAGAAFVLFGVLLIVEMIFHRDDSPYLFGSFLPAIALGMIWSFALAAIGLFFAKTLPPVDEDEEKEILEEKPENNFIKFLETKQEEFYGQLPNPSEEGEKDATAEDGPYPKTKDEAPTSGGFESNHRITYETSGRNYLMEFVKQLKAGLSSNLRKLEGKKNEIEQSHYANKSRSLYQSGIASVQADDLRDSANALRDAENQMRIFRKSCNLQTGERIDYSHRATWGSLALWLIFLGVAEWAFSFYILRKDIGAQASIYASTLAMATIIFLAVIIGYCWQWTKRNQELTTRIIAWAGITTAAMAYIVGIGLLLGYRGDLASAVGDGFPEFIKMVGRGYQKALKEIDEFVIMLLNILAFAIAIYHVAHKFNKFHDYDGAKRDEDLARGHWEGLRGYINDNTHNAIEEPDEECKKDEQSVENIFRDTQVKMNALKRLTKDAVTAYEHIFQSSYLKDIADYRRVNGEARPNLFPPPKYFEQNIESIDFSEIAEEVCQDELQDIPIEADMEAAELNAKRVHDEARNWREMKSKLRSAYNGYNTEVVDAALQDRLPSHSTDVMQIIDPEALPAQE